MEQTGELEAQDESSDEKVEFEAVKMTESGLEADEILQPQYLLMESLPGTVEKHASGDVENPCFHPVDERVECSLCHLEDQKRIPEQVLETVADQLRTIGDQMDRDLRGRRTSFGSHGFPDGRPEVDSRFLGLLPVAPSSPGKGKVLVFEDLAGDALVRSVVLVTVRKSLVAAGQEIAHAILCELVATATYHFRFRSPKRSASKWSVS